MKHRNWLAIAATASLALTGCSLMRSPDAASTDSNQSSSSSSGTMRRAESGSNTNPNPATRNSDCLPGDTRQSCPPDSDGSSNTDVQTPESGAPVPR
jgi:hypothetical protein